MTWTKLSDDFGDETWTLSDAGHRLLVDMLLWSNRKLLDLRIPKDDLRRFAKRPEAIDELVTGGWVKDETDHYLIVFHGCHQPTREQVIARQEANRENGRKGGRPPKAGRERTPKTESQTQSITHSPTETRTDTDGTGQDGAINATTGEVGSEFDSNSPRLSWPVARLGSGLSDEGRDGFH